ncbi:MAG: YigZ family protein [Ferruginibacter sp.]
MDSYYTIGQEGMAEFKDRGSKFMAYAFPCNSADVFKKRLQELKKEHPKAVHHCFAYRIGTDGNTFRSSDDGEPAGTAGKPILGQLNSKSVTDTSIIVVRYFGGTLLGVPGLINAYKSAASMVLQVVPIIQKPVLKKYSIHFDYTRMNEIMNIIKACNAVVIKQESQLFCDITAGIPINRLDDFNFRIKNTANVEIAELL